MKEYEFSEVPRRGWVIDDDQEGLPTLCEVPRHRRHGPCPREAQVWLVHDWGRIAACSTHATQLLGLEDYRDLIRSGRYVESRQLRGELASRLKNMSGPWPDSKAIQKEIDQIPTKAEGHYRAKQRAVEDDFRRRERKRERERKRKEGYPPVPDGEVPDAYRVVSWEAFSDPNKWKKSQRGNYTRHLWPTRVTIFAVDGGWQFVAHDMFSQAIYPTVEAAMRSCYVSIVRIKDEPRKNAQALPDNVIVFPSWRNRSGDDK